MGISYIIQMILHKLDRLDRNYIFFHVNPRMMEISKKDIHIHYYGVFLQGINTFEFLYSLLLLRDILVGEHIFICFHQWLFLHHIQSKSF